MTSMIADKTRAGLMGPNHVRRLARVESIVKDPLAFTDIEPTLDLDFTDIKGAPFAGNLTRATVGGYRMNSKGVMVPTVANEPVIDFGTDGKPVGTGFWGAYTNLELRSEDQGDAAYTKTNITVGANSAVAPDGNTTVDSLTRASNANSYVQQAIAAAIGTTVTRTAFVKAKSIGNRFGMRLQGTYPNRADAIFDLITGSVIASAGDVFTGVSASIENIGGGIYRCSLTATIAGSAMSSVLHGPCDSGHLVGGWEAASATLSDCYVWGFQTTATAFPVPYVPTTSATVTRAADSFIISGTDFSDFFNPAEGTFYVEGRLPYDTTAALFSLGILGSGFTNYFRVIRDGSTSIIVQGSNVDGALGNSAIGSIVSGGTFKLTASFGETVRASINGLSAITDPDDEWRNLGTNFLQVGGGIGAGVEWNSLIRRLTYFPKALPAAELQRMTA